MYLVLLSLLFSFGHSIPLDEFYNFSNTQLTCHPGQILHNSSGRGQPDHVTQNCEMSFQNDHNLSHNVQVNYVSFPYFGERNINNIYVSFCVH